MRVFIIDFTFLYFEGHPKVFIIQIDMSKFIKENFLSQLNGCQVVQVSSERQGAPASNIINDNRKQLWVIEDSLPQYCIIDTSRLSTYPKVFNRVGFYCWHDYESNPELIEIAYAKSEEETWIVAGKIRLDRTSEKQYFKIKEIPVTQMKMLKLTVLKNFGDKHTYLNQVELGFVQEGPHENPREKTFSQFVKLTSTQRELKRALQQIRLLTNQHEELKSTVKKQNQLILKMQDSMKQLTKHIQKMHDIQQLQAAKLKMLEKEPRSRSKTDSREKSREKARQRQKGISSESQAEEDRYYIEDEFIHKKTTLNPNKSSSFHKNSKQKLNYIDSKKTSKMQSILKSRELDSDPNLSEYNSSEDGRSRQSEKCSELVHKLQKLLVEKEKRQKELSRKGLKA